MFILIYLIIKGQRLGEGDLDNITTSEKLTDYEAMQKVYMKNMMPMLNIATTGDYNFLNYLSIRFAQYDGYKKSRAEAFIEFP